MTNDTNSFFNQNDTSKEASQLLEQFDKIHERFDSITSEIRYVIGERLSISIKPKNYCR